MLKKYDEIEKQMTAKLYEQNHDKYEELSEEKAKVLEKLSNEDIEELLKRPYPPQYKTKLKKYLK